MNTLDYYMLTQMLTEMNIKKLAKITIRENSKLLIPCLANQYAIGLSVHNLIMDSQLAYQHKIDS